jgi:hypothetical protein
MSGTADQLNLALLDNLPEIEPDPNLLDRNLRALRVEQPNLAERVAQTTLPAHWRVMQALDGVSTWRTELPGDPPGWLGGTAIPETRAGAVLAGFHSTDQNPTLPALAAGAELLLLLRRTAAHQAVYVFETDPGITRAVLSIRDLDQPLRAGRVILVPPDAPADFLAELLSAKPGLLPPGNILRMPGVSAAHLAELQRLCQRCADETCNARTRQLQQLAQRDLPVPHVLPDKPRCAILCLSTDANAHLAAEALATAAAADGWPVLLRQVATPADVHPLAHALAVAAFEPELTVFVSHDAARLGIPARGFVCEWYLDAGEVPAATPAPESLQLAASPAVEAALRDRGGAGSDVNLWPWSCPIDVTPGTSPAGPEPIKQETETVYLCAARPDDDPRAVGITQPTHVQLWCHLATLIEKAWSTGNLLSPHDLLARAQREKGVQLRDRTLRSKLVELLQRNLIPAVISRRISETLSGQSVAVRHFGRGWSGSRSAEPASSTANLLTPATGVALPMPLAAVFVGTPDPLGPQLLLAAGRGWPLLLHAPGGSSLAAPLAQLLQPGQHFLPFAGPGDLRGILQRFRQQPEQRTALGRRAAEWITTQHNTRRRLSELRELVRTRHA